MQSRRILITFHRLPLSYSEFEALPRAATPALDELNEEFDRLLERMQTPKSKAAMASAVDAGPQQLGRAAVKAARVKRRR